VCTRVLRCECFLSSDRVSNSEFQLATLIALPHIKAVVNLLYRYATLLFEILTDFLKHTRPSTFGAAPLARSEYPSAHYSS